MFKLKKYNNDEFTDVKTIYLFYNGIKNNKVILDFSVIEKIEVEVIKNSERLIVHYNEDLNNAVETISCIGVDTEPEKIYTIYDRANSINLIKLFNFRKRPTDFTIVVDFDGTLCENNYPDVGNPNTKLIEMLCKCKKAGFVVSLWTCREDELLTEAVEYCEKWGLTFDYINENNQVLTERYSDSRKLGADIYIDDKAMTGIEFENLFS